MYSSSPTVIAITFSPASNGTSISYTDPPSLSIAEGDVVIIAVPDVEVLSTVTISSSYVVTLIVIADAVIAEAVVVNSTSSPPILYATIAAGVVVSHPPPPPLPPLPPPPVLGSSSTTLSKALSIVTTASALEINLSGLKVLSS